MKGSLFAALPDSSAEIFEPIIKDKRFILERIVSQGNATPAGEWLSQERDEWVLLARGRARLVFEQEGGVELEPGDYIHIPAGKRHRVEWTDPACKTIWLALHFQPGAAASPGEGIARVKVIRSKRRRKTAGARLYGGTMYIYVPAKISEKELQQIVKRFTARFEKTLLKKRLNNARDLRQVAEELNTKYFGGSLAIDSIQYVTDQTSKFGCCNCQTRSIRIAHTIAQTPDWVRAYVVMHEISHLKEPGHTAAFWKLVGQYPLAERAKGFLMARGIEADDGQ
jgi:cupin 2 domain-containing protein